MTDTPTHAMLHNIDGVEHFYRFAYGMIDFHAGQQQAQHDGLKVYALPYQSYLRRAATGSGVLLSAEDA